MVCACLKVGAKAVNAAIAAGADTPDAVGARHGRGDQLRVLPPGNRSNDQGPGRDFKEPAHVG
ncbi:hypothetical protein ACRAWD_15460 [Caulobacter segnis]